jgi:hypothetical protein
MPKASKPVTTAVPLQGRVLQIMPTGWVAFYDSDLQIRTGQLRISDTGAISVDVLPAQPNAATPRAEPKR